MTESHIIVQQWKNSNALGKCWRGSSLFVPINYVYRKYANNEMLMY